MNDRLAELQQDVELGVVPSASNPFAGDGADAGNGESKGGNKMDGFFAEVETVKEDIGSIRESTKQIAQLNDRAVHATTPEEERRASVELQQTITAANARAKRAKVTLEKLKNEEASLAKSGKAKSSELRIRENLRQTLSRKLGDQMRDYQNCQQKYKQDIKSKVARQVQIVKPDATPEEIDTVLKSGDTGSVFRNAILKGAADPIRDAYANVADKYRDVLALEASMKELHQMFLDFALLTEQQGEILDQIEYQVQSAAEHIDEGNKHVHTAIEYQKSIRKKQCCLIVIILIILTIVLFALKIIP